MPYLTPDTAAGVILCRRLRLRSELADILTGALEKLTHEWMFEQHGDMTPDEAADAFREMFIGYLDSGDNCMIGTFVAYITIDPPDGVLPCDGSVYLREDYPDLYAKLKPVFKIDADHFQLYNMAGRVPVGAGLADSMETFTVGDVGGESTHVLTGEETGEHEHGFLTALDRGFLMVGPGDLGVWAGEQIGETFPAGGGGAHNNMQPYAVWSVGVWWK